MVAVNPHINSNDGIIIGLFLFLSPPKTTLFFGSDRRHFFGVVGVGLFLLLWTITTTSVENKAVRHRYQLPRPTLGSSITFERSGLHVRFWFLSCIFCITTSKSVCPCQGELHDLILPPPSGWYIDILCVRLHRFQNRSNWLSGFVEHWPSYQRQSNFLQEMEYRVV